MRRCAFHRRLSPGRVEENRGSLTAARLLLDENLVKWMCGCNPNCCAPFRKRRVIDRVGGTHRPVCRSYPHHRDLEPQPADAVREAPSA